MYLGIEIGGTKLQLGVGPGDSASLVELVRLDVEPRLGAVGILSQILECGRSLVTRHAVDSIGIGFGGPVLAASGEVVKSHHVDGWQHYPLVAWCREHLGRPAVLGNDADLAALAEARLGAGRGKNPVLYLTVGTGIGGGLVIEGKVYKGAGRGAVEIGHLRPGLHADRPDATVESLASGWGIATAAQSRLFEPVSHRIKAIRATSPVAADAVRRRLIEEEESEETAAADLLARCDRDPELLTAKIVSDAAREGNTIASEVLRDAWQALGWAIAQSITLLAPEAIVVGGGVTLMGEDRWLAPVCEEVERYVFPPFRGAYRILPALLGEQMVVLGALCLVRDRERSA